MKVKMKNKNVVPENYLDKVPQHKYGLNWSVDDNDAVTLEVENKGIANKLMQALLKKPKVSYIHLDEMGNFIWPIIDGKKNVFYIGKEVKEHFGEKAEPLYERLAQYFGILESYGFISWVK